MSQASYQIETKCMCESRTYTCQVHSPDLKMRSAAWQHRCEKAEAELAEARAEVERVTRERETCDGSCDIALARRQVGPDAFVPGNAKECAEAWEQEAARLKVEVADLRADRSIWEGALDDQTKRTTQAEAERDAALRERDVYKQECESISREMGLPPSIRPAEGEFAKMRRESAALRDRVESATVLVREVVGSRMPGPCLFCGFWKLDSTPGRGHADDCRAAAWLAAGEGKGT